MKRFLAITTSLFLVTAASAHDTWVEVNAPLARVGDVVHVDLKLGNHGNEHRDFKLHSRITLEPCTLQVIAPSGDARDLKAGLVANAFEDKQGYWTGRFVVEEAGVHVIAHTLDTLHNTTRAIKSGKTFFLAVPEWSSLSSIQSNAPAAAFGPLGHPLEIVPQTNVVTDSGPGQPLRVQVLFEGQPLENARVTFIPSGHTLAAGFDSDYERTTGTDGTAEFVPTEGNVLLIVVQHAMPDRTGDGYDNTHYTATLTVAVPQRPLVTTATDRGHSH